MTGLLLDVAYGLGLAALSPVWLYRAIRHGRYRRGIAERMGAAPVSYGFQPVIWVHGVSVGEINAARSLVSELHSQLPDYRVVVSSTTDTGFAAAGKHFAPEHKVFHWPMDFTLSVARALDRVKPELVVLMEGDIWPNFLAACNRRDIPAVVVNGRMSRDKGYPGYRKLGRMAGKLFNRLTAIGVQNEEYAELFRSLGAEPEKVHVTGMMKYDTADVTDRVPGQDKLAAAMGLRESDKLVVAGGTGGGEEKMLLERLDQLLQRVPQAVLAIVPRKPERFDEVARLISQSGRSLVRRSQRPDGTKGDRPDDAVLLGDTMGELRAFYALADAVFVGRSLVPMGGSDMIEAAALGKPTAFGPHTFNFPQADELAANGCMRVADADELIDQLCRWLTETASAGQASRSAQRFVQSRQGATRRNVEMICRVLGRDPAVAPGAIATEQLPESR
ncbi:MAG: 3-deoxy-D-manno-octulosonic acid transferase [Phycisphaerae bacterium]